MQHKKQHWIPQSYLRAWCDPDTSEGQEPYVWVFTKDGSVSKRRAPGNLFWESDMYTIHEKNGSRNLKIEHGFGSVEKAFVDLRTNVLDNRQQLSDDDKFILCGFIAALFARTRRQRDHQKQQWGRALAFMEEFNAEMRSATPEQREAIADLSKGISREECFSMDDVRKLAEKPLQEMITSIIRAQMEIYLQMNISIFCTNDDIGYITSDNPCVWYDPKANERPFPYNRLGLGYETVEVTMPISPIQLVRLSWQTSELYIHAPLRIADDFNRRTRFQAYENFVVRRNVIKPIWFEPGIPPPGNIRH